jgi:hypothetical protein
MLMEYDYKQGGAEHHVHGKGGWAGRRSSCRDRTPGPKTMVGS